MIASFWPLCIFLRAEIARFLYTHYDLNTYFVYIYIYMVVFYTCDGIFMEILCFYNVFVFLAIEYMWYYLLGICVICQSKAKFASESANRFSLLGTWTYVINSNCLSKILTRKYFRKIEGSCTRYCPFNYSMTNYESKWTTKRWIPWEMASNSSSMMALYSTMLLVKGPKQVLPKLNSWPDGS